MVRNVILRPVYDRPEMLQLSIEYEVKAREVAGIKEDDYLTLFLVEYGAPDKVVEIAKSYPYQAEYHFRARRYHSLNLYKTLFKRRVFGLSRNILEGMKEGFGTAADHLVIIEDDILLHHTYFLFIRAALAMGNFSVISASNAGIYSWLGKSGQHDSENPVVVRCGHDYSPCAPLLSKYFFSKYVLPYANEKYYKNRREVIAALNGKYRKYWGKEYKYTDGTHNEQAGLINRMVDVAMIEEGLCVITPEVDRQMHIGFYGKNRPGGELPGQNFEERLMALRRIVTENKLYEMSASKQYNDYRYFSHVLDGWDGTLTLVK